MLRFNSKMNNLSYRIKSIIAKKLATMATTLMVNTVANTAAMMIDDPTPKKSSPDDLSWIVIVYDKEEPKD